jgi:hypothetical protein
MCRRYAADDSRIRYVRNQTNVEHRRTTGELLSFRPRSILGGPTAMMSSVLYLLLVV